LLLQAVSLLEAFDAPRCIHQLLFACEERVARRTKLQADLRLGGPSLELIPASAGYKHFVVFGMNFFFHINLVLRAHSNGSHTK
jgi:hypothetical protein